MSNPVPSTLKIEHRSVFGWPATPAGYVPCDRGMAAHYNGPATGLNSHDHSACRKYWDNTRDFHINGNGWSDIGYSYMVCPHGTVLEGRGKEKVQAAQPSGNETYTSCTFGIGGNEAPTDAALQGWALLRQWLRGEIGLGSTVHPHSYFYNTDCPGPKISPLVSNGTLSRAPVNAQDVRDTLEKYLDIGSQVPQTIAAGQRKSLNFEKEYSDPDGIHGDDGSPSIFPDASENSFMTNWSINLETALPVGAGVKLYFSRYERDTGTLIDNKRTAGLPAGVQNHLAQGLLNVSGDYKYRVDLENLSGDPVTVNSVYWMVAR